MDLVNTYGNVGNDDIDNMQLTTDYQRRGYNQLTITEIDTTTIPQIAAGSMIEVGGALYQAASAESISGSASSGTNYIYLVPGTNIVTPTWTTTAPTWSDAKQGWYGTGGSANYRYVLQCEYDGASAYTLKEYLTKKARDNSEHCFAYGNSGTFIISGGTIVLNNVEHDTLGGHNTSTYTYTIQQDGYFKIYGSIYGLNNTANVAIILTLSINSSGVAYFYDYVDSTSRNETMIVSVTKYLSAGDTIKMIGTNGGGTFTVASAQLFIDKI